MMMLMMIGAYQAPNQIPTHVALLTKIPSAAVADVRRHSNRYPSELMIDFPR